MPEVDKHANFEAGGYPRNRSSGRTSTRPEAPTDVPRSSENVSQSRLRPWKGHNREDKTGNDRAETEGELAANCREPSLTGCPSPTAHAWRDKPARGQQSEICNRCGKSDWLSGQCLNCHDQRTAPDPAKRVAVVNFVTGEFALAGTEAVRGDTLVGIMKSMIL